MRKNQITIKGYQLSSRFPKDYIIPDRYFYTASITLDDAKVFVCYADSNNLYEALFSAYDKIVLEIRENEAAAESNGEDISGNNEVWIKVQRLGDQVPEGFTDFYNPKIRTQIITVKTSSENVYKALTDAYYEVLQEVKKYEDLPKFGW